MPKTNASQDFDYDAPQSETAESQDFSDTQGEIDLDIDLTQIKGAELLPDGEYVFEVEQAKTGRSKNGNPKITLQLKVVEGSFQDQKHFEDLTLISGYAGELALTALEALGIPRDFKGNLREALSGVIGTRIIANVGTQASKAINPETKQPYPPRNRLSKVKAAASF